MTHSRKRWLAVPVAVALGGAPIAWAQATSQQPGTSTTQQRQETQRSQQQASRPQAGAQQSDEHLAKARELINKSVQTQDGQRIGQVQDVLLDLGNARAAYLVVQASGSAAGGAATGAAGATSGGASGGSLQNRLIIAPFAAVQQVSDDSVKLNIQHQQITRENTFEAGQVPDLTDPTLGQRLHQQYQVEPYWQHSGMKSGEKQDHARLQEQARAQQQGAAAAATQIDDDARRTQQHASMKHGMQPRLITRAKLMMDCPVSDEQGQSLGQLKDVVIDSREGRLVYGVISVTPQGAAGQAAQHQQAQDASQRQTLEPLTGRLAIVPWSAIDLSLQQQSLVLTSGDRQTLERLSFDAQQFPQLGDSQYATQIHRAFNQEPYWQIFGYGADSSDAGDAQQRIQPQSQPGQTGAAAQGQAGWEQYQRLYDAQRVQTLEGTITDVSSFAPSAQAAPGLTVTIRTAEGQSRVVHLGPVAVMRQQDLQLEQGDRIRVMGSQAQFQGQQVIIARQVQKGDQALLLRNEQGQALWRQTQDQQR
jgi:sporulation protein YlmC with PRC-barrel domain